MIKSFLHKWMQRNAYLTQIQASGKPGIQQAPIYGSLFIINSFLWTKCIIKFNLHTLAKNSNNLCHCVRGHWDTVTHPLAEWPCTLRSSQDDVSGQYLFGCRSLYSKHKPFFFSYLSHLVKRNQCFVTWNNKNTVTKTDRSNCLLLWGHSKIDNQSNEVSEFCFYIWL